MAQFDLKAIISADDNASKTISKVSGAFSTLAKVGVAAAVAGVTALTYELYKCAQAGLEAEDANVKMTQTLKNSGKVTDEQITDLRKYAETLQYKVGIDDENIKSGIAMLGTFKLTGETIKKTVPALADLAVMYRNVTGEQVSLSDWAIKIGKAEALPELAAQLRRIGIVFSKDQIEAMKLMNEEERVNAITKELSAEFGGLAEKMATTTSGRIEIMKIAFGELQESIGGALLTGLAPFIEKLAIWASSDQAQAKIKAIGEEVGRLTQQFIMWITNVAIPWVQVHWPAIKNAILTTVDAIKWMIANWSALAPLMGTIIALVGMLVFAINPLQGLLFLVAGAVIFFAGTLRNSQTVIQQWKDYVVNNMNSAKNAVYDMKESVVGDFYRVLDGARSVGNAIGGAISGGVQGAVGGIKSALNKIIGYLNSFIRGYNSIPVLGDISEIGYLAKGGMARANQPYIVGEQGPELFVPSSSGRVIPNSQISNSVNITFTGNITNTSKASLDSIGQRIGRQVSLAIQGI